MKFIITGGGSGGHAIPALTIAKELFKREHEVFAIGSFKGIEKELFEKEGIKFLSIPTGKLRRYFSWENFIDPFKITLGIIKSFFILKKEKPDVLFGTGGFVSIPPVIAAKILGIPVFMHEQTISVGLANRIAGKFAKKVFLTFPDSSIYFSCATETVGMPIREELLNNNGNLKEYFSIDEKKPVLFITGGAQGSKKINDSVISILPQLLEKWNVIHQFGHKQEEIKFKGENYFSAPFYKEEMPVILKNSDLLIGRSGAGTVIDCAVTETPGIFIPLPHATMDEQTRNAMFLVEKKCALILKEKDLTSEKLLEEINSLIENDELKKMKTNFLNLENLNGIEKIISGLIS